MGTGLSGDIRRRYYRTQTAAAGCTPWYSASACSGTVRDKLPMKGPRSLLASVMASSRSSPHAELHSNDGHGQCCWVHVQSSGYAPAAIIEFVAGYVERVAARSREADAPWRRCDLSLDESMRVNRLQGRFRRLHFIRLITKDALLASSGRTHDQKAVGEGEWRPFV